VYTLSRKLNLLSHHNIDIDECVRDSIDCGVNAVCINTNGSYRCECVEGFYRNGSDCCELSANVLCSK
jgi:hypothetical protein